MAIRVVQWTTGNVGKQSVQAVVARPDCVVYNPMWFDVDEMVRILEAGVNMVVTAAFVNGRSLPGDPELPAMSAAATVVFSEAVAEVGDALGIEFDEIVCEAEYARTTKDLDLGSTSPSENRRAGAESSRPDPGSTGRCA